MGWVILFSRNRRSREKSILKATVDGAQTLYDIVAKVYSSVDRKFWWAASSNVRLHIEKLAVENKLPEVKLFFNSKCTQKLTFLGNISQKDKLRKFLANVTSTASLLILIVLI